MKQNILIFLLVLLLGIITSDYISRTKNNPPPFLKAEDFQTVVIKTKQNGQQFVTISNP